MFRNLLAFVRDFYRMDPRASRRVMALVVAAGVLEGVGIMLFLPFFQSIAELSVGSGTVPLLGKVTAPDWMTPTQVLLATCALFLAVATTRAFVLGLRDARVFTLVLRFVDALRLALFRAVAESPWHKQAEVDQAEIESAMISGTDRVRAAAMLTSLGIVDIFMVAAQSAVLLYISPPLALMSFGLIAVAMIAIYPQIRRSFDLGKRLTTLEQDLHLFGTEFLADLKTAKSQNLEARHMQRFGEALTMRAGTLNRFRFRQVLAQGLMQVVIAVVAIVILLTGVFLLSAGPAVTLLTVIILGRLTSPVFRLYSNYQVIAHTLPVYDTIDALTARFGESPRPATGFVQLRPDDWRGPVVALKDVGFARPGAGPVVEGVTLSVDPGEAVALCGPSGSGKTTILDVILGLHRPTSGFVWYFGQPTSEAAAIAFRDFCSYVPQEAFLLSTSIRDNLRWICPEADEARLRATLDGAGGQALSLDQEVGTRGARLSGGERQRVRLAQALLRRPRLLVLDEALNAIGQDAVAPLMASLRAFEPKMALLYVTHRLSDLGQVDRVYELSGGRVRAIEVDGSDRDTYEASGDMLHRRAFPATGSGP
ncbi:ATP-binding cassette domain-containing protein [Pseudooceanicola sp.]|uniref:ATP-binding cassette domain-containing protein n=1 Tax=Pseudooceanicola sp. TaxID=1914328 RepID=UPI0035C73DC4